jgi:hypothetical protein
MIQHVFFSIVRGISWLRSKQGRVKPKTVQIVICCFFAKNAVLMSKLEIWLANNNNESKESGMSAC